MQDASAEAGLPFNQGDLIDVSNEAWAGKSRREMTPEERDAQDVFIRQLSAQNVRRYTIAQELNVNYDTVNRIINGQNKQQSLAKRAVKRVALDMDFDSFAQVEALANLWDLSRQEVIRILIDWGIEALDGEEKDLCEKAAANCTDGQVP